MCGRLVEEISKLDLLQRDEAKKSYSGSVFCNELSGITHCGVVLDRVVRVLLFRRTKLLGLLPQLLIVASFATSFAGFDA